MGLIEKVKSYFMQQGALYIVIDDNNVLTSGSINEQEDSNMHFIYYNDPIELRFIYERDFRYLPIEERKTFIIIIHSVQFTQLPYDMIENGHRIDITLEKLFPLLDSIAVSQCSPSFYEFCFDIQNNANRKLNYKETLIFIFEQLIVEPLESLHSDVAIVKAVVRYYNNHDMDIPRGLLDTIKAQIIKQKIIINQTVFDSLYSKYSLREFLNTSWRRYVLQKEKTAEKLYEVSYFDDHDFQGMIHDWLDPVEIVTESQLENLMKSNVIVNENVSLLHFKLQNTAFESYGYKEWGEFASQIGELNAISFKESNHLHKLLNLINVANKQFEQWMRKDYASIASLPDLPKPKMMHHIPSYLSKQYRCKVALIVMDGMSYTQWQLIRHNLSQDFWEFEENPIYSWVPSITSVSRQSIFSGKTPREFADSIETTNKEEFYWKMFWKSTGLDDRNISFQRSLGLKPFQQVIFNFENSPFVTVYGAVIDVIDKFMHGAKQGSITVNSELMNWLETNYLRRFVRKLSEHGFDIYLTADHGNVESTGRGRIDQGVTVESVAQRLRIYKSEKIRNQTSLENNDTFIWDNPNLPDNYFILLAENNSAFVPKNDKIVSHGGIHIEEMIVPFVRLYR